MGTSVRRSIERLPARFRGSQISARYRLNVEDDACEVVVTPKSCHIEGPWGNPDVEISTDADTWHSMQGGRLSGIEAFADRRLVVRGSIEKSLHFEPSFERPKRGGVNYSLERIKVGRGHVSALMAGDRRLKPLILIHGLGATKASWLTVVPQLARHHRVIAIDLPGFGASTKPNGSYTAPWFADSVFRMLDQLGLQRVLVAGNSMGGRVAMEMAMRRPERVDGIACLCPAAAFSYRPAVQLVKLLRPELSVLAGRLPRSHVISGLKQLFARPDRLHDTWYEAAVDDFLAIWRSPRARIAFSKSLRNIYLDEPLGDSGFWSRLSQMQTPALYVYGKHDALITHHFARKMRRTIPHARVKVWNDCGHVPQIEFPARTVKTMMEFFHEASPRRQAPRAATGS